MPTVNKILITDRFSQEGLLTLKAQNYLEIHSTPTPDISNLDLSEVSGLIIRSRTQITEQILSRAKKLQVIVTATSGFDHIDLEATKRWGITAMFTPNANVESAAQLTFTLALSCANQTLKANKILKAGEWREAMIPGMELNKKTWGVVGLGRIGSRVSELANAFGMHVIAYDPYIDENQFREADAERVSYEEILKRSDILSFHVPATKETNRMLHRSHFDFINRGIILINTSRGQVISESDLVEALEKSLVHAVGLDVFEKEPLSRSSKLLLSKFADDGRVVLTPHIGAYTNEAFQKASLDAAIKLIKFYIDGSTTDTLPPKAPWYGAQPAFQDNNP
jgi:D-3-phosphoglycerate dehydrogenase / 2-oxoglutarate reductase